MQPVQDDVMTGVAGRVQDALPGGAPDAGRPPRATRWGEGEALEVVRAVVHVRPLTAVLLAGGAGLLAGLIVGRRRG